MDKQTVRWKGEDQKQWYATVGIDGKTPCIFELGYELAGERLALAKMLHPQFKAVTAKRTKINPQRAKALAPGEELDYQWDTYSDDPMSHKENVQEANQQFDTTKMDVSTHGNVTTVTFDGDL